MKKLAVTLLLIMAGIAAASAQKFAMVDMEYILRNIPAYEILPKIGRASCRERV